MMKSLKNVSNLELINQLKKLVEQENNLTLKILPHLIEIERRGLFRDLGFRSLYDYCTRELKYSESGAMRRIHAARAIEKCPSAMDYLREDRVNLSTLSLAWKYLTPELLDRISDKSRKEVEAIVAEFNPELYKKDKIRPVVVVTNTRGMFRWPFEMRSSSATEAGARLLAKAGSGATRRGIWRFTMTAHRSGAVAGTLSRISGCCAQPTINWRPKKSTARLTWKSTI
jgi:hypothetical protein